MNLQSIINQYENGNLADFPDAYLESARLEVESAADQARYTPTLEQFRNTLLSIELFINRLLFVRYGCND